MKFNRRPFLQKLAAEMLPPAPEEASDLPSMQPPIAPDVESIQKEHAKMVEEMESSKEDSKEESIDALLKGLEEGKFFDLVESKVSVDTLVKLCRAYHDLAVKY